MKLSNLDIQNLKNILKVCQQIGIDLALITEGFVRGINDAKSCVIISDKNIPDLDDLSLGLTNMNILSARLGLFDNDANLAIDVKSNNKKDVFSLDISGSKAKVQFRATSSALIKVPKMIDDAATRTIEISKDEVKTIINAAKVMSPDLVFVNVKSTGEVRIEMSDANKDVFSIDLDTPAVVIDENSKPASATTIYDQAILMSLLRTIGNDNSITVNIGDSGSMWFSIMDHTAILLAKMSEGE